MESNRRTSCMTFRSVSLLVSGRHQRLNSYHKVKNFRIIFIHRSKCDDLVWEKHDVVCSVTQYVRYAYVTSIRGHNRLIKGVLRVRTSKVEVSTVSSLF
jgi:hypothetical protein